MISKPNNIINWYLFFIILTSLFCAFGLLYATVLNLCIFSAVIVLILSIAFPKNTLILLAVYLIFQSYLVFNFDKDSLLGLTLDRVEEIIILISFIILVLREVSKGRLWRRTIIDIPLAGLILIAILSSIKNHAVPYKLAGFDLFLLLKGFLVFYIFSNLNFNSKEIQRTVRIFFTVSLFVFILGIIDLIAPEQFRAFIHNTTSIDYRFGIPGVQSIFIHPGPFGWFMAFIASFCFAFYLIYDKKKYLLLSFLFFLGVIFSMRFKSLLGTACAICVGFLLVSTNKKIRLVFVLGVAILFVLIIFGPQAKLLFEDKIYGYIQSPSIDTVARNVLYKTSVLISMDNFPLGSGLGTFGGWIAAAYYSPIYRQYGISEVFGLKEGEHFSTDTFWPYILGQFGIFGLILYVCILAILIHGSIRIFRGATNPLEKAFALGSVLILVDATCESMAGPVFTSSPCFYYIFASLGIVNSFAKSKDNLGRVLHDFNKGKAT